MVHLNVYADPAAPLKIETALEVLPNVPPVPVMILQLPVPTVGVFPASVTDVNPHVVKPV